ncbi:hypothetical protein [Halomonas sp. BC04]|uniref:hypothetical protein n=1 Tax=Halomonas sp. BC04 TaxID=1403540 RepID=UPI0003ED8770|nr:hypothetical protein [Halomonas sp. BC04]EWG99469.1 hypothetical protein Q427_24785 [Halomonas sp. BC04]
MHITTVENQALMPECVMSPLSDGSITLTTVHHPVDDLSFYRDILKMGRIVSHKRHGMRLLSHDIQYEERSNCHVWLTNITKSIFSLAQGGELTTRPKESTAAEVVALAKKVTGLSVKDLAPIFDVTRQSLYNFRRAQDRISERNWQRLNEVEIIIKELEEILPDSPGSLCKHFAFEGETLYELLCASRFDSIRIKRVARELAKKLASARQAHSYHQTSIDQLTRHG